MPEATYKNYEGEIDFSQESDENLINVFNELKENKFKIQGINKTKEQYFVKMFDIIFKQNKEFYEAFGHCSGSVCAADIENEIPRELARRYINSITSKPKISKEEIVNKIKELTNKTATRQINIKHGTLYDVKEISFNTKTNEYDVVYASSDDSRLIYSRPYEEFVEKFKPKYGCI